MKKTKTRIGEGRQNFPLSSIFLHLPAQSHKNHFKPLDKIWVAATIRYSCDMRSRESSYVLGNRRYFMWNACVISSSSAKRKELIVNVPTNLRNVSMILLLPLPVLKRATTSTPTMRESYSCYSMYLSNGCCYTSNPIRQFGSL